MKSIRICSLKEAVSVNPEDNSLMIRIFNSPRYQQCYTEENYPIEKEELFKDVLIYEFDDINPVLHRLNPSLTLFNRGHALEILGDFQNYASSIDHLVVHCIRGISRSSAIAKSLNQIFSLGIEEKEYINPEKHYPNSHIYETMLETARDFYKKRI